ncbi:hypothetical protein ABTO96_19785, partial [Acinetobacter baumannii]
MEEDGEGGAILVSPVIPLVVASRFSANSPAGVSVENKLAGMIFLKPKKLTTRKTTDAPQIAAGAQDSRIPDIKGA